jgi:chitinase
MARKKAAWIKEHRLGGGMWWESSADGKNEKSLIANVVDVLGVENLEKRANCLEYPESKYENLKKSFPGEE